MMLEKMMKYVFLLTNSMFNG